MCGIAGWIDWQVDLTTQRAIIERMANTVNHRGPDAQGCWLSPRAALAHRRLIVIDPQWGGQPMLYQTGDTTYAITYNGEIYNFKELRKELELHGHAFRTQSDTEVILHAYTEWGVDCIQRLNGIFGFGLWDERRQQLLLARDHMGVKPLFYAQKGSAVLFGSEMKTLLAHPLITSEVDQDGLAEIFGIFPSCTPGVAVFRDIQELRPGHALICDRNQMRKVQYWSLRSAPHTEDLATTIEHIRSLLDDTVRRQLIADVPVVTMLSGGLDSSGLTALAGREFKQAGKQLNTYSIDFADSASHFQGHVLRPSLDAPWVKRVSEHVGTEQHAVIVDTPDLIENLLMPLHAHDHPGFGDIETSLYLLFKAMKQDATVAISGEAADEVFGGYPWFHSETVLQTPTFPWLAMILAATNSSGASNSAFSWLAPDLEQKIQPMAYLNRRYQEALAEVPRLPGEDAQAARMRELFYLNQTRFLSGLLERKDRTSMAVGFEVRVPFCDYRLVEYVWNIPWSMKMTGNIEKGILREAFADVLPDDARNRKKSAYPVTQNPTYLQATRDWTLSILNNANAPILPFVNSNVLRAIAEEKVPVPAEMASLLYERVIQIDAWLKDYHVTVCW